MKLRFRVNQAEALRRGVDSPKSIAVVEIDPAKLNQEQRHLIADRLDGIDVCRLGLDKDGSSFPSFKPVNADEKTPGASDKPWHIETNGPAFDDLMAAILKDQERFEAKQSRRRDEAATVHTDHIIRHE